jgi:DNA-binding protein WhiA
MKFNEQVKLTLSKFETSDGAAQSAELYGFVQAGCLLVLKGKGEMHLKFETEYAYVASRIYSLIKKVFVHSGKIGRIQANAFGDKKKYFVLIDETSSVKEMLHFYEMMDNSGQLASDLHVSHNFMQDDESRSCYLRGVFLAAGYVADPAKSIQMEFRFNNEAYAASFVAYLEDFDVISKARAKKNDTIVYIRRAECISALLAGMGDHKDMLVYEDRLAMRQMKNTMQRKVNCETANLNKMSEAAYTQTLAIEKIIRLKGMRFLSDPLIEAAQLRLDNPYSPLSELAQSVNPPMSRSTLDKRLRKIVEIAQAL